MNAIRCVIYLMVFGLQANTIKEKATILYQNNLLDEANIIIGNFLTDHPYDLEAIELAGDIAVAQKNWDEAIRHFEKLVRLNSNNADFQYKYGGALGMKALSVSKWESLSYLGDMRKAFEKSIRLDSHHLGAYWALISYHCKVPGILGGNKKKAYKLAHVLMQMSTLDGLLAHAFLAQHEGKEKLADKLYQDAILNMDTQKSEEELRNIYNRITYKNKLRFDEFLKFTKKYRPEAVAKRLT
jgi:tetratricopeptide (TPR) repeat protein